MINGEHKIKLPKSRADFHASHLDWEKPRHDSLRKNITEGTILVDVGTEVGDFAALFALWGARVVCIEPQPKYWPMIKKHFDLNKVRPLLAFAGFASTTTDLEPALADFEIGYKKGWPLCAYDELDEDWGGFRNVLETGVSTPQTRLDDLLIHRPDILNIDVEGAELEVLKGAERILRKDKPFVYVSVHTEMLRNDYGVTQDDLESFLEKLGYDSSKFLSKDHEIHMVYWNSKARKLR